jgi:hypothetical protein
MDQRNVDRAVLPQEASSSLQVGIRAEREVLPGLRGEADRLGPVFVLEPDPVDELRPRFAESKGGKLVAVVRINCEDLGEPASPDPAQEFEGQQQFLLGGETTDEDCNPDGSDANFERTLGHLGFPPTDSGGTTL